LSSVVLRVALGPLRNRQHRNAHDTAAVRTSMRSSCSILAASRRRRDILRWEATRDRSSRAVNGLVR
jgi:hypothetical protein